MRTAKEFQLLFGFQSSRCSPLSRWRRRCWMPQVSLWPSKEKTSILFEDQLWSVIFFKSFEVLVSSLSWSLFFWWTGIFPSEVSFHMFIMQSFHFSSCINEIRTLIHLSLSTFFIQFGCPTFLNTISFFSCCNIGVIFQWKFVTLNNLLFGPPIFWQRLAVFVILVPSFLEWFCTHHAWVGEPSATPPWLCSTFVAARTLRVWHHGCGSFWWRDQELTKASNFFFSNFLVLCESIRHLPHEQKTMPISWHKAQSEHCFLEQVSQRSKISVLPKSVINFFDFSLHVFISSVLFKSCRKDSLFGWFSNSWINFLTFYAVRVLLLDCRTRYAWYLKVDVAAAGFSVTSRYALVVWGFCCFLLRVVRVVRFANSASEKHEATLDTDILCGKAPP